MNMHLETHRQTTVFSFLKFINKMKYIQRIASPMRKKFEIRPCEEFEFLIRKQEYNLQTRTLFFAYFEPFSGRGRIRTSKHKFQGINFWIKHRKKTFLFGFPKYILLKRKWVTI